ncbi:unnamed protein product, partial [Mesorhabditis spiculigera]
MVDLGLAIALGFNLVVGLVLIVTTVILWMSVSGKAAYLKNNPSQVSTCIEPIQSSEMPIAVVCTIANCLQMPLQDVAQEYVKDQQQRAALVLANFRKDSLTQYYLQKYPAKFITHGYIGEEMLVQKQ